MMTNSETKQALKELQDRFEHCGKYYKALDIAIESLTDSAPKHPGRGKWLDTIFIGRARCSVCDKYAYVERTPFCPYCGAMMEGEDNDE